LHALTSVTNSITYLEIICNGKVVNQKDRQLQAQNKHVTRYYQMSVVRKWITAKCQYERQR